MFSKINHVAVVSENYAQLAQFYIAAFGMKTGQDPPGGRTVGDGWGLNINPRRAGRPPASIISASRSRIATRCSTACAPNTRA